MSEFIDIIGVDEVPEGSMVKVSARGDGLLVANVGGEIYVAKARCPHIGADLTRGRLDGSIIRCAAHGSRFDLSDGHVVSWVEPTGIGKLLGKVGDHHPLEVYDVQVEGGRVMVGPQKPLATNNA